MGAAAYYLTQAGAVVVGILDKEVGIIAETGMDMNDMKSLISQRKGNQLFHPDAKTFKEINEIFWGVKADVFIPAAASKLVSYEQISQLISNGLQVVSSGANVPFKDSDIFFGEVAEFVDSKISLIPDFIANCGMARTFAYLMDDNAQVEEDKIFEDVSQTMERAIKNCYGQSSSAVNISKVALEIALKKLIS